MPKTQRVQSLHHWRLLCRHGNNRHKQQEHPLGVQKCHRHGSRHGRNHSASQGKTLK